jgi:hypothetical protein
MTLSPPVRVAALVGALVLTGLAAFVFLLGRGLIGGEAEVAATPPQTATAQPKPATKPGPAKQAPVPARPKRVPSGFPAKVDHALRYSRVVVVSVSVPGAAVDRVVKNEARAAAKSAHAGFVALSTANERAMSGLVAKTGVLAAPAVVIVKRPGVVTATFSVTDAGTIAQAVAQSRR